MKSLILLFFLSYFFQASLADEKTITIFTIGDSTMANKSLTNGNLERGWGQMLQEFFTEDVVIDNHAKDGRSSLSFINEGRWDAVLSKLCKGDYVFIQFGHNDEKADPKLHTEPGSTFDANLRRFVTETRAKGATPVLFNSIVRRNFPPAGTKEHQFVYETEGDVLVDTHGAYLESPRRVAREMNVLFVDANKVTHDLVADMGVEQSKKLFMWVPAGKYAFCPKGKVDNTHLNIYGAKLIAGILIEAIAEILPELVPYLRHHDTEVYVAAYKNDKQCAISYTFDDGLQEHYTLVYPELEKYGFKGTFWVCGKIIEDKEAALGKARMTWNQLKEMSDKGHEISNHGWSHLVLRNKKTEQVRTEIAKNDSVILAETGKRPLTFCYPGNFVDEQVIKIASEGRVGTRLRQYAIGGEKAHSTSEALDKWVNELLLSGDWGVTMTHGITYGYDSFGDPVILWEHLKKVKAREDSIWVGTFREVAAYVKERKNVQLNVLKDEWGITVVPFLELDSTLFSQPLTMVVNFNSDGEVTHVKQNGKELPIRKQGGEILFDFNPYGQEIQIFREGHYKHKN